MIIYFVNSGCDDSHMLTNIKEFALLRDAKKYYETVGGYHNSCKELKRIEFGKYEIVSTKTIKTNVL